MRMDHPNILRIEGVALDLFPCCIVSRWMENGNMLEYLNQYQGHIDRLELVSTIPTASMVCISLFLLIVDVFSCSELHAV